ncbi:MAG: integrase core domain-containing protein [Patescibacteria group bacterium]
MKNFKMTAPNITQPIIYGTVGFKRKPIILQDKVVRWRGIANQINLSPSGRLRLEWMIFYETVGGHNATKTADHFDISRKIFYKWFNRFDNGKVQLLCDQSKAPKNTRKPEITFEEECRIKKLRKKHIHYGKRKLAVKYFKKYKNKISSHKVQYVINKWSIYPDVAKHDKLKLKLKNQIKKNRIQKLKIKDEHWFLLHLDTIVIYWGSFKRYILTAVDHHGKVAYARMYKSKSSKNAKDFLYRLHYLIDANILNVQTDNGSEFYAEFEEALNQLEILHWFSRNRTPEDNAEVERFNQTLQTEWLNDGNFCLDTNKFNCNLTEWLIEYNFERPHETLDYLTPFEYLENTLTLNQKVLPMYSACTSH